MLIADIRPSIAKY